MSNHVTRFPTGFDYAYRPQSYFQDVDPKALILSSILGEERRKDNNYAHERHTARYAAKAGI